MKRAWKRRRSNISGSAWAAIMEVALDRHDDAPTVEQVCDVMREMYPMDWQGSVASLLPLVAAKELRETMKEVAFLREAARERGLPDPASIASIRASFARYSPCQW